MSYHLRGEILQMLEAMGPDADLDGADSVDEYEDHLYNVNLGELHDIYSSVNRQYERWLEKSQQTNE